VEDDTPRGRVVMFYDASSESFWWFSDNKEIPYKYLEALCRKYILAFDCIGLYHGTIDGLREAGLRREAVAEERIEREKEKEAVGGEEEENVFVAFKKYNSGGGATKQDDNVLIPEESNRYSYRGKMTDWKVLQLARERAFIPPEETTQTIDFAAFKRMQKEGGPDGEK
jgi:hypothetical protein